MTEGSSKFWNFSIVNNPYFPAAFRFIAHPNILYWIPLSFVTSGMSDFSHHFNERVAELHDSELKYLPNSLTMGCHGSGELVPWIKGATRKMEPVSEVTMKA